MRKLLGAFSPFNTNKWYILEYLTEHAKILRTIRTFEVTEYQEHMSRVCPWSALGSLDGCRKPEEVCLSLILSLLQTVKIMAMYSV